MKNIAILLCLLFALSFCTKKETEQPQEEEHHDEAPNTVELTKAQFETAQITTGPLVQRNLSDVVIANGVIDIPPQNLVSVSAPLGGFVRSTNLLQGMKVKKGQLIATIENPDFIQIQQDYLETTGRLEYARQEYERQSELAKEQVNARKTFQQAAAEVSALKARLSGLREKLKTAGISLANVEKGEISNSAPLYAPISGSVTTVNVNLGKYVNPTDVMFEIVDTEHLHAELSVFEQDIPKLKLGQLVRFTVSNNPAKEHLAKVYLINQMIGEDRTVRVHCHLEHDDAGLLPQNFVKAIIETGAASLPALPDQAIVDFEGKAYIFIQKEASEAETHFEMVEVTRGVSENGYTAVKPAENQDLSKASIVQTGAYALLSKMKNSEGEGHAH